MRTLTATPAGRRTGTACCPARLPGPPGLFGGLLVELLPHLALLVLSFIPLPLQELGAGLLLGRPGKAGEYFPATTPAYAVYSNGPPGSLRFERVLGWACHWAPGGKPRLLGLTLGHLHGGGHAEADADFLCFDFPGS